MDLKAKESSWRTKASDIFKQSTLTVSQDVSKDYKEIMHQYRNILYRKTKLWWNRTTLENYLSKRIIPRGLRVQLYPTFELQEDNLTKRWVMAATTCSCEFIQILIEKNTLSLTAMDEELESIQTTLQKDVPKDVLDKWLKELDADTIKWEVEVSQGKLKKCKRDMTDYDMDRVHKWQNKKKNIPYRNRSREPSVASSTSGAESHTTVSDAEEQRDFNLRTGARKKQFPDMFYKTNRRQRNKDQFKVVNLSYHEITPIQTEVLERGLNFSPSSRIDEFVAIKDTHLLSRKIILKKLHFKSTTSNTDTTPDEIEALEALISLEEENAATGVSNIPNHLYSSSKKFPALSLCPAVEVFTKLVTRDIEHLATGCGNQSNLNKMERMALEELKSWKDVVYKPADKGGNLVIWPCQMYEKQAYRLLDDVTCYWRVTFNPLLSFQEKLVNILDKAFIEGISRKLLDTVKNLQPRLPTFYIIPKLHKNPVDPPGRPIVAVWISWT
ncbi:uncharacterized protein LOC143816010 [Ranitomeya variabilis]|uniref:uncharacterized protein LOC143816010 n=1 Tax=Ranitomeya variabilis TaxID=490064 RepID=UPI004057C6C3